MLPPAALLVATLLLAGCVPSQPNVMPVPEPSATPIFASDEEALAAATEAYAKYLEAIDESLSSFDVETLKDRAEGVALDSALTRAKSYQSQGDHQIGQVSVISSQPTDLESVLRPSGGDTAVQIYVCLDLSGVDVRDSAGNSIVAPDRPDRIYQLVSLVWHSSKSAFKVTDDEVWANEC